MPQPATIEKRNLFPHRSNALKPIQPFNINGRWLYLYANTGRPYSTPFSLYWGDENTPVQHAMNYLEVFSVLSEELEKAYAEQSYAKLRTDLRQLLEDNEISLNPGTKDNFIISSLKQLIERKPIGGLT